jgi:hypothetical protein
VLLLGLGWLSIPHQQIGADASGRNVACVARQKIFAGFLGVSLAEEIGEVLGRIDWAIAQSIDQRLAEG